MISNSSMTGLPFNIRSTGWQGLEVVQQIRGEAHRMSNFLRGEKAVTMEGTSTEHVCGTMSGRRSPCLQEWVHDCMVLNLFSQSFSFPTQCAPSFNSPLTATPSSFASCSWRIRDGHPRGKGREWKERPKKDICVCPKVGGLCIFMMGWSMLINQLCK